MQYTQRSWKLAISLAALVVSAAATAWAAEEPKATQNSADRERELIAVLRSDAPAADKAITCKLLAIYGSGQAVTELAPLLADEHLASWSRIALEAIPGSAADEALRKSLDSLKGQLLVGAINSIGVRRDAGAVEYLSARLRDSDPEVAAAAAVALGRIGNPAATELLRRSLTLNPLAVRSAVAEGCVLCAERRLAEDHAGDAAAIYDDVRKADVPKQRIIEATRGAILARKQDGLALLLEQLRSSDKLMFQLALGTAREFPGTQVDEALAGELAKAAPQRAALIVTAMADRTKTVQLPAVLKAAESGPREVRVAALQALGRVGDASCLAPLLMAALDTDADVAQAAKASLADLPGDRVNADIVARLGKADGKMYLLLLELVGLRRIEAQPALLKALESHDAAVRGVALAALGQTVAPEMLSVLIKQVVAPKYAEDLLPAEQALMAACVRMPEREACATELAKALDTSPAASKPTLLKILGAVAGSKALETLAAAAKGSDPELQDVSSRLLGEWATIDVAPVLLDLSKTAPGAKYQVRALRGYIRVARQFVMPDKERAEMCRTAFAASQQTAEQKLVLEILKRYPSGDMLTQALEAMNVPEIKDDAGQAALAIAQKLGSKGGNTEGLRKRLAKADLGKVKLEIIKAEYGAGANQKDVTDVLAKQAGNEQILVLPKATYNESFGGDPAQGAQKQLKIKYRLNGKAGEASFGENALIVLLLPK